MPARTTLAVGTALLALSGCGSAARQQTGAQDAPGFKAEDPGAIHVHGLGTDPADGALFIATHTGLFRAGPGERTARRVAGHFQDTMGFTVVGPHRFLGSGHPDLRTGQPPYLGLIRSNDAGRSWRAVSLMGRADFHVLEAAGRRVVGYGTDLQTRRPLFLRSDDEGRTWRKLGRVPALIALAMDPGDADVWVAATDTQMLRTTDAGRTWKLIADSGGLLGWAAHRALYALDLDGDLSVSVTGGRTWTERGRLRGRPAAFEAERDALLAALHDGAIMRSTDGGRSWRLRSTPRATVTAGE